MFAHVYMMWCNRRDVTRQMHGQMRVETSRLHDKGYSNAHRKQRVLETGLWSAVSNFRLAEELGEPF